MTCIIAFIGGFLLGATLVAIIENNNCEHEWELTDKISVMVPDLSTTMPARFERVYICKKCKKCKVVKY